MQNRLKHSDYKRLIKMTYIKSEKNLTSISKSNYLPLEKCLNIFWSLQFKQLHISIIWNQWSFIVTVNRTYWHEFAVFREIVWRMWRKSVYKYKGQEYSKVLGEFSLGATRNWESAYKWPANGDKWKRIDNLLPFILLTLSICPYYTIGLDSLGFYSHYHLKRDLI